MKIRKKQRNFRQRAFPWPRYTKANGKKEVRRKKNHRLNYTSIYADESNRLRFLLLQSDSCIFFFLTSSVLRVLSKCNERKNESTTITMDTFCKHPQLHTQYSFWSQVARNRMIFNYAFLSSSYFFTFVLWFLEMK